MVGQIRGEGLQVTAACPLYGDVYHSVSLQNFPCNTSPDAGTAAGDRRLFVGFRWYSATNQAFASAAWYPDGHTASQSVAATAGTTMVDVFQWNSRTRGVFDLTFGNERVCGCFDAPIR
jgi:hypothetical protein